MKLDRLDHFVLTTSHFAECLHFTGMSWAWRCGSNRAVTPCSSARPRRLRKSTSTACRQNSFRQRPILSVAVSTCVSWRTGMRRKSGGSWKRQAGLWKKAPWSDTARWESWTASTFAIPTETSWKSGWSGRKGKSFSVPGFVASYAGCLLPSVPLFSVQLPLQKGVE